MTSQGNGRNYSAYLQTVALETATYRRLYDYWRDKGHGDTAARELADAGVSGNSKGYEAAKRKHGVIR